ncbi:hypothetical protein [Pseudanabaena sp. PCC 6802]|uniref:DUF7734 family protein n=1 Tax=Pseudanabaena sp. PCC 6802 TaxID=118173 RepID=UPI000346B6E1|nr:hypothetical protein [Pseudanabaena sp. PCC 6802]
MNNSVAQQLESYTVKFPTEVLLVRVEVENELDEIMIFKGFSSSLVRATAFDPDVPVIPDNAKIVGIDRLAAPYNSRSPNYIEQNISWEKFQAALT